MIKNFQLITFLLGMFLIQSCRSSQNNSLEDETSKKENNILSIIQSPFKKLFFPQKKQPPPLKEKGKLFLVEFNSKTQSDAFIQKVYGETQYGGNRFAVLGFKNIAELTAVMNGDLENLLKIEEKLRSKEYLDRSSFKFAKLIVDSSERSENPRWKLDDKIAQLTICFSKPKTSENFLATLEKAIYFPVDAKGDVGKLRTFVNSKSKCRTNSPKKSTK